MEKKEDKRILKRAREISQAGGIMPAVEQGKLPAILDVSFSEALILGLLKQKVSKYLAIFGHGSTDLANILRLYESEGVTKTYNFRNEISMAHTATILKWQYHETVALVTSIGPGALQAMAGSLASSSNNIGIYHIYGDETTHGEGYNMQQIPKNEQHLFGKLTSIMGHSYILHTPGAIRDALRQGSLRVNHPYKPGPFYFVFPMNQQNKTIKINLNALPIVADFPKTAIADEKKIDAVVERILSYHKIVIKVGGGGRCFSNEIKLLAETIGAVVVLSPRSLGVLPDSHHQNMHIGGSKGSLCGNYAMQHADLLLAIGSRPVCQSDSSGTAYESTKAVININGDVHDAGHYNHTLTLTADIGVVISQIIKSIKNRSDYSLDKKKEWLNTCRLKKQEWTNFKESRVNMSPIFDTTWGKPVLTQPVAINIVAEFAKSKNVMKIFDAGDVQANGFQIVEDDTPLESITETGASYMGFAASTVTANGIAENPQYTIAFSGDGSFMMNPQVLIDAVEHKARGMIVIFDNRRMAAISGLQKDQYGDEFKTNDSVRVNYVKMASSVEGVAAFYGGESIESLQEALNKAYKHKGLSVIHLPVYAGSEEVGGMGAYGSWNVGNWCNEVQGKYFKQDI